MSRVIHRFQAFETLDEAMAFKEKQGYGYLLKPDKKKNDRIEYNVIRGEGCNTDKYPFVLVWNEVVED